MTATTTLRLRNVIMSRDVYTDIFREPYRLEQMKQELNSMARKNGWNKWVLVPPKNRQEPYVIVFCNPPSELMK